MILVNGDSFTTGEESPIAWPGLVPNTVNIATPGASNDYILSSTVRYIRQVRKPNHVIVAWTTPNRIEISGKHLTPTSQQRYGSIVDAVFKDWDEQWAREKFLTQVEILHTYLVACGIPHFFISTFDIQTWAHEYNLRPWLGWPDQGIVEWMGDCPKGPGGHPLELGHQRIAERINEHIRNIGWIS
jgi:hypothetical protein